MTLGLLGGGGSVLTVPIFVYLLGVEVRAAVAGSLAVVAATALVGAVRHARAGNVDGRVAAGFIPFAMAGAWLGARVATRIPPALQLLLFAVVMLAAAALMFRRSAPEPVPLAGAGSPKGGANGTEAPPVPGPRGRLTVAFSALGVGGLTGLVGVGGGFMIVPALVLLLRLPMKRAIGTSLVVIVFNASAGFAGYLGAVEVPWRLLAGFALLSVLGIGIGVRMVRTARPELLRRGFAIFLVVVGGAILVENLLRLANSGT